MKFADYFKEAIAYGESLGLRNGIEQNMADIYVELDEPEPLKRSDGSTFYPSFLTVWESSGIDVDSLNPVYPLITVEQQLKLVSMFVSAYSKYLADKKEPVATDSNE